jgi:hypothetical protein
MEKVTFENVQSLLDNGLTIDDIFDKKRKIDSLEHKTYERNFTIVNLFDKVNVVDENNKLLFNEWFDGFSEQQGLFVRMRRGEQWNFLGIDGKPLSEEWFDKVENFNTSYEWRHRYDHDCVAPVMKYINGEEKWNCINQDGEVISEEWFDEIANPDKWVKIIPVRKGPKRDIFDYDPFPPRDGSVWNYINYQGELLSEQWFDEVEFAWNCDFARVYRKHQVNFIDTKGKLLSEQWFDNATRYYNTGADVTIKGVAFNFSKENGLLYQGKKVKDIKKEIEKEREEICKE